MRPELRDLEMDERVEMMDTAMIGIATNLKSRINIVAMKSAKDCVADDPQMPFTIPRTMAMR